jgi:hypothetical protein
VARYVLPFHAKTARFCGSDSLNAGAIPIAFVRTKLVRWPCGMLRSTNLEGFLVSRSYEVAGYVLPFRAETVRFCGSDSLHTGTVPIPCVHMKLVG